jgi:hypothetical protein
MRAGACMRICIAPPLSRSLSLCVRAVRTIQEDALVRGGKEARIESHGWHASDARRTHTCKRWHARGYKSTAITGAPQECSAKQQQRE